MDRTSPVPAAEDLARRLEDRCPPRSAEIEALVRLAEAVRSRLAAPAPRPDFVHELRRRLTVTPGGATGAGSLPVRSA